MLRQSLTEFAESSLEEIEPLRFAAEVVDTYQSLFASLKEPPMGKFNTPVFTRWHSEQVHLISSLPDLKAAQEVSNRILGPIPGDPIEKSQRETFRKRLSVVLARGRNWDELVKALGWGILFKHIWVLGKAKKHHIQELISGLKSDEAKMKIFQLLEKQIEMLLDKGQTDPRAFRDALGNDGVLLQSQSPDLDISGAIASFQDQLSSCATAGRLQIKNTDFQFDVKTLSRLNGTKWFNDELILLCLRLSDRLPNVRIGFSIPTHQQTKSRKFLNRPFQAAAQAVGKWRQEESPGPLVCLFPLHINNNHFALLEINYQYMKIYFYDSQQGTEYMEQVQDAAQTEFKGLEFHRIDSPKQLDGSSCGPLVVASATKRMVNREVSDTGGVGPEDALGMRKEALHHIKTAWDNGFIIPAEHGAKRRDRSADKRPKKRQKSG
ncbi:hypothetical protein F5Y16DRAFT_415172 [Xylariaceae sp. FL0255]|nr:hypothetical protein F5Y16DRAFT_415172 [Xylariaceae sp. FL0255]